MSQREPTPTPGGRAVDRTRDHLANERTFLAWIRTSLGLIGLGFVLARMGLFLRQLAIMSLPNNARGLHPGHEFLIAGVLFLLIGTTLSAWAGWLYFRALRAIEAEHYEPDRATVLALTAVVVVGGLLVGGLVLWRTIVE